MKFEKPLQPKEHFEEFFGKLVSEINDAFEDLSQ
jgi:hypothetical protein